MRDYLHQFFRSFWNEDDGNSATEYAIMIALILVLCLATLLGTGDVQKALWSNTAVRVQSINLTN